MDSIIISLVTWLATRPGEPIEDADVDEAVPASALETAPLEAAQPDATPRPATKPQVPQGTTPPASNAESAEPPAPSVPRTTKPKTEPATEDGAATSERPDTDPADATRDDATTDPDATDTQTDASPDAEDDRPAGMTTQATAVRMDNLANTPVPSSRPNVFPDAASRQKARKGRRGLLSSRGGGPEPETGEWSFDYHGYLRAPMRIGMGHRDAPAEGQSETTFHNPVIPDDQYLSYQYTLHNARDWAELYFSYGNQVARGTVSIQGFNFTDAAWKENDAQFGIAQAFVTITPKLKPDWVRLLWKVGSFDNRYGAAGRYDAGELDTYLFGRTHGMGEAGQVDFLIRDFTLSIEHGLGATRPDPSEFNTARFTIFNHEHVGLSYQDKIEAGFHFLNAFAREEDREGTMNPDAPDGTQYVVGPDLRVDWGRIGYLYAGYSYIQLENARVIGPSIEVLHSKGGGQFTFGLVDNYINGRSNANFDGTGKIHSVMAQFQHSVQRILKGEQWYGQGRDLELKVYGMLNKIESEDEDLDGIFKFKYGSDLAFSALRWFGIGMRYDRIQPNNRIPEQSFAVLSPRLFFRTNWVTHEEITVQYSRYFYNQRTCPPMVDPRLCVQPPSAPVPPEGFGSTPGTQDAGNRGAPTRIPDENVFLVRATFWW